MQLWDRSARKLKHLPNWPQPQLSVDTGLWFLTADLTSLRRIYVGLAASQDFLCWPVTAGLLAFPISTLAVTQTTLLTKDPNYLASASSLSPDSQGRPLRPPLLTSENWLWMDVKAGTLSSWVFVVFCLCTHFPPPTRLPELQHK